MQTLILLALLGSAIYAAPVDEHFVDVTEDSLGGYKVFYKTGDATKTEERHEDGSISGAYSYVDPDGHLQSFQYSAGQQGVHAVGPSVPEPVLVTVSDTPEVAVEHLTVVETVKEVPEFREVPQYEYTNLPIPDFIVVLTRALQPNIPLVFSYDTPEIIAEKEKRLSGYKVILGH